MTKPLDADATRDLATDLGALYNEESGRFDRLAAAAGLRARLDFRSRDLRTLNFAGADLRGFDFSGSDLTGTGLRHAAVVDETTTFDEAELDAEDRVWVRHQVGPTFAIERADLARALRAAIGRDELFLVYQPKVALKAKGVVGLEALARWRHPERGLVPPTEFIVAAEEYGMAVELTRWTLDHAVAAQEKLAAAGHDILLSINLAPDVLHDSDIVNACIAAARATKGRLGFEFPELAVIRDPETAIAALDRLADAGAHLAIDDYGAGFSSLAQLRQIPADELKIDQMFIRNLTSSTRDPLIVRSTIDLAHALDMQVTAEGVETHAALALLTVMGCDAVQGYLIARPLELDDTLRGLDEQLLSSMSESQTPATQ